MSEKVIVLRKCPCCDEDAMDKIKDMQKRADDIAERIFLEQNETREYSRERQRVWAQAKADLLKYVIDLLEDNPAGRCL